MPSWVLFTIYIPAETEKQPEVTSKSLESDDRTNYTAIFIVLRKTEQQHFADSTLEPVQQHTENASSTFIFFAKMICNLIAIS